MTEKIRIGIIGTGQRGTSYARLLGNRFARQAEIAALADANSPRLKGARNLLGLEVPLYTDYAQLLDDPAVDAVIITTPDYTHQEVAVKALSTGKHVLCEKPLATTVAGCAAIVQTVRPGQVLQVGFVLRHNRVFSTARELIASGAVGRVHQIVATDNRRGGDYFHRWHRLRAKSGGLFNHKSTHLLDIVTWFADGTPESVTALGGVKVYGPRERQGERCLTCSFQEECPEYLDLTQEPYRTLYLQAEDADGYIRDACAFASEKTTVDNGMALVSYDNGVTASYHLCLYAPLDTRQVMVFGDQGKLELDEAARTIVVRPRYGGDVVEHRIAPDPSGHGGGDEGLVRDFLRCIETGETSPLADAQAGALSSVLGLAAEDSAASGRSWRLEEFVRAAGVSPREVGL